MRRIVSVIAVIVVSLMFTSATFPEMETENRVSDYVEYEVPNGFMELPFKSEYVAETDMVNGDTKICVTVYKATKENHKEIYVNLCGRGGQETTVCGEKAREGWTDIDHMIVVEKNGYIYEFFACHTGTAFTGKVYGKQDERVFKKFLKTVNILSQK